ncbi:MAG: polyphosphate kinase 2, partial [Methylocystis sp.]|nr:polyphosphate kinase 2 [Methylocystis sp.]
MNDKKAGRRRIAASCVAALAIDAPRLPAEIAERALASGDYPYDKKIKREVYVKELRRLQIELLKLLDWVKDEGERIVIVVE